MLCHLAVLARSRAAALWATQPPTWVVVEAWILRNRRFWSGGRRWWLRRNQGTVDHSSGIHDSIKRLGCRREWIICISGEPTVSCRPITCESERVGGRRRKWGSVVSLRVTPGGEQPPISKSEETYGDDRLHGMGHLKIHVRSRHWHHESPGVKHVSYGKGLNSRDKRVGAGGAFNANTAWLDPMLRITEVSHRTAVVIESSKSAAFIGSQTHQSTVWIPLKLPHSIFPLLWTGLFATRSILGLVKLGEDSSDWVVVRRTRRFVAKEAI